MIAIDTSLLAYAINRYAPEHGRAARIVEDLANGDRPWALPWPVVHEFLNLVTHPHGVYRPLKASDAWGFVGQLLASPTVRALTATERHAQTLVEVLAMLPGDAGLHPGLETAVLLREHGVRELLSADRGMRRFPFLDVRNPVLGDPDGWERGLRRRRYRMLTPRPATR